MKMLGVHCVFAAACGCAFLGVAAPKSAGQLAAEETQEKWRERAREYREKAMSEAAEKSAKVSVFSELPQTRRPEPPTFANNEYFRQLYDQELARFQPPMLGEPIIVYLKAGGSHSGRVNGITDQHIIVDSTTYTAKDLAQETCGRIFATYCAYQRAQERLSLEKTGRANTLNETVTVRENNSDKKSSEEDKRAEGQRSAEHVAKTDDAALADLAGCWMANGTFDPPTGYTGTVHIVHVRLGPDGKGACFLNADTPPTVELTSLISSLSSTATIITPQGIIKGSARETKKGSDFVVLFAGVNEGSEVTATETPDKNQMKLSLPRQTVTLIRQ